MTNHVDGKVILITGAGGGFGRILAEMTAALGARVVATDVDGDAASATADAVVSAGGEAMGSNVDQTAIVGLTGQHTERFGERVQRLVTGVGLHAEETDVDDVRYWAITPEDLVRQIVYAIDQPWGITINDLTVRATGEDYVR
jgi:NAD(P)-dependent dehydrogenase (short-subunit alcohol dehydrogenase family)